MQQIKISKNVQKLLRCPICHAKLIQNCQEFVCVNSECDTHFPIIDGIPILINEKSSLFDIADYIKHHNAFFRKVSENKVNNIIDRIIPTISKNIKGRENYEKLANILLKYSSSPLVLVIGGSILGQGMEVLLNNINIKLVESDVSFGIRTQIICDAHDIPFLDKSFDGVIVQAVLEHVADPYKCVNEAYRVLKRTGIVYAETAFIQQVHGGRYDFTRFTHLGHRRLFRMFDEIDSGPVCGPGMALAWSYNYFLLSFTRLKIFRMVINIFSRITSFYLKYIDYYLINKLGSYDAASGFFFMGKKSKKCLSDKNLIKQFKGID